MLPNDIYWKLINKTFIAKIVCLVSSARSVLSPAVLLHLFMDYFKILLFLMFGSVMWHLVYHVNIAHIVTEVTEISEKVVKQYWLSTS